MSYGFEKDKEMFKTIFLAEDLLKILTDALEAADQCGRREGETLSELIRRLHDEANADE